jgi:glycosyltransferase involved in cell wall biosynthesis
MKILSITAGAGGMYCGTCLRDNAMAAELLARGHDVTLLPLYTPTLTDERNVSRPEVLFGGLSVYLQQRWPWFRSAPRLVDRILDSPALIRALAGRSVSVDARALGDLTVSMLRGLDGVLRKEFEKFLDWVSDEPRPDVIDLSNSLLIGLAGPLREALGRPVCCTLQGEELFLDGLVEPFKRQALTLIHDAMDSVDRFIAVSEYCAGHMSGYLQIPRDRISVVPLGINMSGYDDRATVAGRPDRAGSSEFRIGYFARVAPEKGLQVLADSFIQLQRQLPSVRLRLEAAGYLAPSHKPYLDLVQRSLERAGLIDRFTYQGALDRTAKLAFLGSLDVLSVPATYDEPKGVFLLEAMASGVPVVQPRRGAFVEVIEKTGGGLLFDHTNEGALTAALQTLWQNAALRDQLRTRGVAGVRAHYTVQRSADRALAVYEQVAGRKEYVLAARH